MVKNTKQRLMEAAIELFSTKGFAGTGVDEIAAHIGLKGPNLYKYYKGKDDLLAEIDKRADEEYEKGMLASLSIVEKVHTAKDLKKTTLQTVEFTLNNEMAKKMRRVYTIEQFRNEKFAESATKHQLSNLITVHERLFNRLMDEGVMINGDAELFAFEFVSPITMLIQLYDRDASQLEYVMDTLDKHIDVFIDRFFTEKHKKKK